MFAVTEEKKLDADRGATTDQIKQYQNVNGMAPAGQKGIGHRFDTILRMTMRANGDREITMAGDRGRQRTVWAERGSNLIKIGAEKKKGFAYRYLVDIAGWDADKDKAKKGPARRR